MNLSPKHAATAAVASYRIQSSTNVSKAFADLSDQFDLSPASRFKGISGGAFLMQETGFGVIARGKGMYTGDALVVVRGTNSLMDAITDAHAGQTPHRGKTIHSGFHKTFKTLDIENLFQQHFAGKNPTQVHCVGHSLGGAVATLVADWAARKGMQAKLYTFGCPRVGHQGFAQDVTMRIRAHNIFRVYHSSDIVPMIPLWPFVHVPDQGATSCYIDFHTMNPKTAHSMDNYLEHVKHRSSFKQLRQKPPSIYVEAAVKTWLLHSGAGFLNSYALTMINHAMAYLIQQTGRAIAFVFQDSCGGISDFLDKLAKYLQQGAKADKEINGGVKSLMQKMLTATGFMLNMPAILTTEFIRWVFTVFTNTLYRLARTALRV